MAETHDHDGRATTDPGGDPGGDRVADTLSAATDASAPGAARVHGHRVVEVAPRTWFVQPSFVNVAAFETDEGVVLVDTGFAADAATVRAALRSVTDAPLHTVVFTHGHVDHAFGLRALLDEGERPRVVAHENVPARFERYARTAAFNSHINQVQFATRTPPPWPREHDDFVWPDTLYRDTLELRVGGERFVCAHGKGETDDATYVWAPERGVLACGDFWIGVLPNCGNPSKVQRYPEEWARTARRLASLGAEVLLPGHGAHQTGAEHIRRLFLAQAEALEAIVEQTLAGLNAGLRHDEIVAGVALPEHLAAEPTLAPLYDRPEFIARNVIRRYGGWWNGYAAELLPAPPEVRGAEVARLAGGADALAARARQVAEHDLPLACHLAEWAFLADPGSAPVQDAVEAVFTRRAESESSLMGKGVFHAAARAARDARRGDGPG